MNEAMLWKYLKRCYTQDQVQAASFIRLEIIKNQIIEVSLKSSRKCWRRRDSRGIVFLTYPTFMLIYHERIELETSAWSQKNQFL